MNDDEKEVLKAGAEAALQPITDIIKNLFGGPAEQIGGMWTDTLAAHRQIRGFALVKKVQAAAEKAGFTPRKIPDDILLPALREALLQDDESLQEKWANLLANASDPRRINPVRPSYSQILKELTPFDARFLDELYRRVSGFIDRKDRPTLSEVFTSRDLISVYVDVFLPPLRVSDIADHEIKAGEDPKAESSSDLATAIDVLLRHRILGDSTTPNPIDVSKLVSLSRWNRSLPRSVEATSTTGYHFTALGTQFVKACQSPPSVESN